MIAAFSLGVLLGFSSAILINSIKSSSYIRSKSYLFTRSQIISKLKDFQLRHQSFSKKDLLLQDPTDLCDVSEITNITNNVQNIEIYKPKY